MSKPRRPPPKDNPEGPPFWDQKADLVASTLEFRNRLQQVVDNMFYSMVKGGSDISAFEFTTQGNRPVVIAMAIGGDAASALANQIQAMLEQEDEEDNG